MDDPAFAEDRAAVFKRAREAGVIALINPGSNIKESEAAIKVAREYANVFAAVGVHPHAATSELDLKLTEQQLEKLIIDPVVVAVGEFGLDVKHGVENLDVQIALATMQIQLAKKHELPVILHCRGAYDELIQILKKDGGGKENPVAGVVHCFAGGPKELRALLDLGLHIAYGGLVTFGKKTEDLLAAVMETPLERMLLETDAPYLTPVPRRGKRNEPAEVATVAQFIADLRKIPYAELARVTTENARNVFALSNA